jgi:hypothetical protein
MARDSPPRDRAVQAASTLSGWTRSGSSRSRSC